MQVDLVRPGVIPSVLLTSARWNPEAVRRVSYGNLTWRALLVTDEMGPVGAVCFTEPEIYPHLVVDTVLLHPERKQSAAQLADLLEAVLPVLKAQAVRLHATSIVFEAVTPELRMALAAFEARHESITMSLPLDAERKLGPALVVVSDGLSSPCGRRAKTPAGAAAHERHCTKCKELANG